MRIEHGAQTAVAGRLADDAERGPTDEDRVPPTIVRVDGHDDGTATPLGCLEECPDDRRRDERLVAKSDEDSTGILTDRLEPDLERARQAAVRLRVHDPA